jgi:hypothetical protein
MKYLIFILLVMVVILSAGCTKDALQSDQSNNSAFNVDPLFTHDGCDVYRFADGGRYIYFARCGSVRAATMWNEYYSSGKSGTHIPRQVNTGPAQ